LEEVEGADDLKHANYRKMGTNPLPEVEDASPNRIREEGEVVGAMLDVGVLIALQETI
jgi:hypothetical protein